ncbi:MAG: hypothetical protein KF690_09115 [Bacteroidetes bacterium]|nr:hypothetical protein [Bacteroidota bacterium]
MRYNFRYHSSGTPVDVINNLASIAGASGQGVTSGCVPVGYPTACTGLCTTLTRKVAVGVCGAQRVGAPGMPGDPETSPG